MNFARWPRKAASNDLRHLHRSYIAAVNHAVALNRDDLARELADAYLDEAHRLLASQEAGTTLSPQLRERLQDST
jgi:hypothetical protein